MLKIYTKYGKAYLKAPWNTFNTYAKYFTHFMRVSSTLKNNKILCYLFSIGLCYKVGPKF